MRRDAGRGRRRGHGWGAPLLVGALVAAPVAGASWLAPRVAQAAESTRTLGGMTRTWLEALLAEPDDTLAAERLLEVASGAGELPQVRAVLQARARLGGDAKTLEAGAIRARLAYAVVLAALGDHTEVVAVLSGLEQVAGSRERGGVASRLGESLLALGRRAEALDAWDRALAALPAGSDRREMIVRRGLEAAVAMRDRARVERLVGLLGRASGAERMQAAASLAEVGAVEAAEVMWRGLVREADLATGEVVARWQGLSDLLERAGRTDDAAAVWRDALGGLPAGHADRAAAWQGRLGVARRAGGLAGLAAELAATEKPEDEALVALARIRDELGLDADAVVSWQEAVRRMPRRVDVHEGLVAALGRTGATDALVRAWDGLVKVAGGEPRHLMARIDALMGLGRDADALAALRSLGKATGGDPGLVTELIGRWLRRANPSDRKEIEALFRQLRQLEPGEADHVVGHGGYLWSLGDKAGALAIWRELAQGAAGPSRMAEVLLEHDLLDEAQAALDANSSAGTERPEVLRLRARIAEKRRRDQDAAIHWLGAVRGAAEGSALAAEARERLLAIWKTAHQLEAKARELARGFTGRDNQLLEPAGPAALADARLAVEALLMLGLTPDARSLVAHMARRGATGSAMDRLQEQLALRDGDRGAAADFAEALARADRPRATIHFQRAVEHARAAGDLARAERLALAAVTLNPGEASARVLLGDVAAAAGRNAEAAAAWQRALDLTPGDAEVLLRLAALARTEGDAVREASALQGVLRDGRDGHAVQRAVRRLIELSVDATVPRDLRQSLEAAIDAAATRGAHRDQAAALLVSHFEREALRLAASGAASGTDAGRVALARRAQGILLVALGGVDEAARDQALRVLERLRPDGAVSGLVRLASRQLPSGGSGQSPELVMAGRAIAALGHIGTPEARAALVALMPTVPPRLREVAGWALGRSGVWPGLEAWMATGLRERTIAGLAASRVPSAASQPILARLLDDPVQEVREIAIRGLGRVAATRGDVVSEATREAAVQAIARALADPRNHRSELLAALRLACASVASQEAAATLADLVAGQLWTGPLEDTLLIGLLAGLVAPPGSAPDANTDAFNASYDALFRPASGMLQWSGPIRTSTPEVTAPRGAPLALSPRLAAAIARQLAAIFDGQARDAAVARAARQQAILAASWPPSDPGARARTVTALARVAGEPGPVEVRAGALSWLGQLDPTAAREALARVPAADPCEAWRLTTGLPLLARMPARSEAPLPPPAPACLDDFSLAERSQLGTRAGELVDATARAWLATADRAVVEGVLMGLLRRSDGLPAPAALEARLVELALGVDPHLAEGAARAVDALGLPVTALAVSPHAAVRAVATGAGRDRARR